MKFKDKRMDLEEATLSKIAQTKKDKHGMYLLISEYYT